MNYLLDTNACIAIIKGTPGSVRLRFDGESKAGAHIFVSSLSVFELCCGLAKSNRREASEQFTVAFLAGPIQTIPFDDEDARAAGLVRADLEKRGSPIGAYDLLIAGQAMRRGLRLVTANAREFRRIGRPDWENWAV